MCLMLVFLPPQKKKLAKQLKKQQEAMMEDGQLPEVRCLELGWCHE